MAIWLPLLPTDRLQRQNIAALSDRPLAFYAKSGNAFVLTAVNARAMRLGLRDGMALTDARAICSTLVALESDVRADAALLDQIAAWCERYTPITVLDPPHGLFLDVTGCAHLYDGEAAMLADVKTRIKAQGFHICAAIAPTLGAAWALAHFQTARHRGPDIVEAGNLQEALASLPISALRLEPDAAAWLKRLGLKFVGQIAEAPRAAFTARAGQKAMQRLDQALGRTSETFSPRRPPPPLYTQRKFAEPIITLEALLCVASDLCDHLCAELDTKGMGARLLSFVAFGLDGRTRHVGLRLSRPERDSRTLLRLLREKLAHKVKHFNAGFGFEAMRLDVLEMEHRTLRPTDLAPSEPLHDTEAEARLIDIIAARLGSERIGKLGVCGLHTPERISIWQEREGVDVTPPQDSVMRRPLTQFPRAQPITTLASTPDGPPLRFRWRRVLRNIVRAEGPERITPNWLRAGDAKTRDYYRVEDERGRRYWLYREGFYDDAEPPRWFLHGLFV